MVLCSVTHLPRTLQAYYLLAILIYVDLPLGDSSAVLQGSEDERADEDRQRIPLCGGVLPRIGKPS